MSGCCGLNLNRCPRTSRTLYSSHFYHGCREGSAQYSKVGVGVEASVLCTVTDGGGLVGWHLPHRLLSGPSSGDVGSSLYRSLIATTFLFLHFPHKQHAPRRFSTLGPSDRYLTFHTLGSLLEMRSVLSPWRIVQEDPWRVHS